MTRLLAKCLFRVKRDLSQEWHRAEGQKAMCFVIAVCVHIKSILINCVIEKLDIVSQLRLIIHMYSVNTPKVEHLLHSIPYVC